MKRVRIRPSAKSRAGLSRLDKMRLDKLAREVCLKKAGYQCERCGKEERLQWHHVYTRRLLSLRWEPDNLVCLCAGCHLWWHQNTLAAAEWFEGARGTAVVNRLRIARNTWKRPDFKAVELMLREAL